MADMGIIATHRVTDSNNQTAGFMINGTYTAYYDAVRNINLIDNLILTQEANPAVLCIKIMSWILCWWIKMTGAMDWR